MSLGVVGGYVCFGGFVSGGQVVVGDGYVCGGLTVVGVG